MVAGTKNLIIIHLDLLLVPLCVVVVHDIAIIISFYFVDFNTTFVNLLLVSAREDELYFFYYDDL